VLKLRSRKQRIDSRQKVCRNCQHEYFEHANFNWSCRIHRSEYGGEMWWCCGKSAPDAPGCKFGKHLMKDDDEDDEQDQEQNARRLKCLCCKQIGHLSVDCPRDPNLKTVTMNSIGEEEQRVSRIQTTKGSRDASVVTHNALQRGVQQYSVQHIFGLRSLEFDDYNYGQINSQILSPLVKQNEDAKSEKGSPGVARELSHYNLLKYT